MRIVIFIFLFCFAITAFWMHYHYLGLLILVFALLSWVEYYRTLAERTNMYEKIILSILQNDFSAYFPDDIREGKHKNLFKLYESQRQKQQEQQSIQSIYESILNDLDAGLVILKKAKASDEWDIFLMNSHFAQLFDVPRYSKWKYLQKALPNLTNLIEASDFSEVRTTLDLHINGKEAQSYTLHTSKTNNPDVEFYTIFMDSIQRVMERKEKQAWLNLMQIISHELMNSITPIKSLSHNIKEIIVQEKLHASDLLDVRQGMDVIVNRTEHLQHFIDNYRKLTELPSPQLQFTDLSVLLQRCLSLMMPTFKEKGITVQNQINNNLNLKIDSQLIEQVLINLFTNSIYALEGCTKKEIILTAEVQKNRIFLHMTDTGKGIETEIRDKIFMPFFTTRTTGAGIGLTLSKSIMEAHGGYLTFKSEPQATQFSLCFVDN